MNRRDLLKGLVALYASSPYLCDLLERFFWSPTKTILIPSRKIIGPDDDFAQWLINQNAMYNAMIIKDILPTRSALRPVMSRNMNEEEKNLLLDPTFGSNDYERPLVETRKSALTRREMFNRFIPRTTV